MSNHGSPHRTGDMNYADIYSAISERRPYLWQTRIGGCIGDGNISSSVVVPTGGGKTGIIASWMTSWVVALMKPDVDPFRIRIPRRIVWVVNRRTVVDDIGAEAAKVARRIIHGAGLAGLSWGELQDGLNVEQHGEILKRIALALNPLAGLGSPPVAVSSLRGELVDHGEWKQDPARLSIIIGTPMKIGSKLFFCGLGEGKSTRPLSAAMIGCDSFIVHDEAHLEPAFDDALAQVKELTGPVAEGLPPTFQTCSISATPTADQLGGKAFILNEEEKNELSHIIGTKKKMRVIIQRHGSQKDSIVELALELGGDLVPGNKKAKNTKRLVAKDGLIVSRARRVIVFMRNPKDAASVADRIAKTVGREKVGLLAGTIRGYEREVLVNGSLFKAFKTNPHRHAIGQSIYLVSTSAGEVGVDIDGDAVVMDGCPLDSLVQRLGRAGRAGNRVGEESIEVVSVWRPKDGSDEMTKCIDSTLKRLRDMHRNQTGQLFGLDEDDFSVMVGPQVMTGVIMEPESKDAIMPKAESLTIGNIRFEEWGNTSHPPYNGVIPFEHYLVGKKAWDPPTTEVSWRVEIDQICECDEESIRKMVENFPVRSVERLTSPSSDVEKWMQQLASRKASGCFVSIREGNPRLVNIESIFSNHGANTRDVREYINDCELIVPTSWGGLSANGMLEASVPAPADHSDIDVAERDPLMPRQRMVVSQHEDGEKNISPLIGSQEMEGLGDACRLELVGRRHVVYRVQPWVFPIPRRIPLDEHLNRVAEKCRSMATRMGLDDKMVELLTTAGATHDLGKDDPRWQAYANNTDTSKPLARSDRYGNPERLGGYRHEAGSLSHPDFQKEIQKIRFSEGEADWRRPAELLIHIVATHHGHNRPGFKSTSGATKIPEMMNGFVELNCLYGPYQLALLESVLKCADRQASLEECE